MPFSFTLAYENAQSKIFGRVARIIICPETGRTLGIAVEFADLQGHDRFVRDDLLLYAMTKKYMEMWDTPNNAVNA